MDKSIVAVEESHKSDPQPSASKSLGSLVQINSIAIDISCAMEDQMETPEHEHFSIRGFVAGMRKKDSKICSPFGSGGDGDDFVDNPPQLSVPRFRWWQCSSCVPNIASETTLEMLMADRSDIAGTSSCQKVDGKKDGLLSHSILNIGDGIGPGDSGCAEDNDPSCKEKTDFMDDESVNPQAYITENNAIEIREGNNNAAAENPPNRVDEQENASSGSDGAFSALPHRRKPKLRSLADIMEEEKNSTSEHARMRSSASTEMEADLDAQLQLDHAPADVAAKGNRSPQRKRKISLDEDRETATYPIKRLRGHTPDVEKKISDSESEGNTNVKTQQMKPKKHKALDISRKMRQTHIDNRAVLLREVGPKTNAIVSEMGFSNMGPQMGSGPYFMSFLSGQEMDRISNLSKNKRPEVDQGDHSRLMPPRKEILGDCNAQGKVALDLSLNSYIGADQRNSNNQSSYKQYRGIPDLNESFTERTSMIQGKQLPTLSDKRSLTHKTLDMSASCSKEHTREGKRQLGAFSEPQAIQNMENNLEPSGGASDDIPMEIVELLAKNQRERALGNSRKHLTPHDGINNSIRGSPAVYIDGRPSNGIINFPNFPSTRNSLSVASGKTGVGQGILNYPQVKDSQLDIRNQEDSQFKLFSSFTPSQQRKTQFSASNSHGADLLWPPRRKNVPFHLNVNQNRPVQPNGLNFHSFSDKGYKGKTISDIKGQEKREGRIGSVPKSVGSLDAYSNDTIPAMQLLSLMDRGIVSGSSFKVGSSSFLDKSFSPCDHHPRLNGNENQKDPFLSGSTFPLGSHTKDFPGLLNGVCFSGESLKKSYFQGQKPPDQGNSKAIHLDGPSDLLARPSRANLALEVCTLNRNPADFSVPDARNEYTISAKDLKPRKKNILKERSFRPVNVEGRRRHRVRIDASRKEYSRK